MADTKLEYSSPKSRSSRWLVPVALGLLAIAGLLVVGWGYLVSMADEMRSAPKGNTGLTFEVCLITGLSLIVVAVLGFVMRAGRRGT